MGLLGMLNIVCVCACLPMPVVQINNQTGWRNFTKHFIKITFSEATCHWTCTSQPWTVSRRRPLKPQGPATHTAPYCGYPTGPQKICNGITVT